MELVVEGALRARAFERQEFDSLHNRYQDAFSHLTEVERNSPRIKTEFVAANLRAGAGGWSCEVRSQLTSISSSLRLPSGTDSIALARNSTLVKRVFQLGDRIQLAPGAISLHYPDYSAHNEAITQSLVATLSYGTDFAVLQTMSDELIFPDIRLASAIAIGGPISHELSRLVLGYYQNHLSARPSLIRLREPYFDLPFEYVVDSNWLLEKAFRADFRNSASKGVIPNWLIRESDTNRLFVPSFADGMHVGDYLLLTVLPNFLDRDAYDKGYKLVIMGGAHGLGTRSIVALLRSDTLLSSLETKTQSFDAWQALVPVVADPSDAFTLKTQDDQVVVRKVPIEEKRLPHFAVARALSTATNNEKRQDDDTGAKLSGANSWPRIKNVIPSVTVKGFGKSLFVEGAPRLRDVSARILESEVSTATGVSVGDASFPAADGGYPGGSAMISHISHAADIHCYPDSELRTLIFESSQLATDAAFSLLDSNLVQENHIQFAGDVGLLVVAADLSVIHQVLGTVSIEYEVGELFDWGQLSATESLELQRMLKAPSAQ